MDNNGLGEPALWRQAKPGVPLWGNKNKGVCFMKNQELKLPKNKAQIFPQPYPSAPCDMYGCSNRAKWFIGRPDGPLSLPLRVCDECMRNIVASVPEEYLSYESHDRQDVVKTGQAMHVRQDVVKTGQAMTLETYLEGTFIDNEGRQEAETFQCPNCGKEFEKQQGLSAHLRHCKAANNEEA